MFGPAIRNVYKMFDYFTNQPISIDVKDEEISELDEDTKKYLDKLWGVYKNNTGAELVTFTHQEKPWQEAWEHKNTEEHGNYEITADSIKEFFERRLGKHG